MLSNFKKKISLEKIFLLKKIFFKLRDKNGTRRTFYSFKSLNGEFMS